MENLKKRIQQLKKKRSGYKEVLDFYQKVREEQEKIKPSLNIKPILLKKEWKELLTREGFPLLEKKDFPLDIEASFALLQSLFEIGKVANPHMAEQVKKIAEAIKQKRIDAKKLLKESATEQKVMQIADEFGLDRKVLFFFIHESIRPSIEAGIDPIRSEIEVETWLKGHCPICGSLPHLSLLREEAGKRYLLCSFCGYQWRIDRLFCPFCNNKEQGSLQYFCGEGEETYRIDLCDKCHQYIKTIDLRNIEEVDPLLEDLATFHLDLLSSRKGYQRPIPNPWTT